jgi:dihydroorotase/N-acyl-D-amino-acid deacylase
MEGPDGSSPLPIANFLDSLEALPLSLNIGTFVGQGSVRAEVVGEVDRTATAAEIERMKAIVERSMREGAFGMTTGLFYVPGTFTPTEEIVELARVAGRLGGIHTSHMREEASRVVESVAETIRIGEEGGLPTQVTHHKVVGPGYWGASERTLALIDEARARGVDATVDQYPYTASSTSVQAALLPAWVLEGGSRAMRERLAQPEMRARARAESAEIIRLERGGGDPKNVGIARCDWDMSLAGKDLAEVTRGRGLEPTFENAAETAIWIAEQGGCQGVFHAMSEEDLVRIMRHPTTMVASDGEVPIFGRGTPHPRSYGTFARVLGVYVREQGVLTLEDAVRRMSSYPAQRLGLTNRGVLRPGMKADLSVFDPATVRDVATFEQPHQYAEGFALVVVNGEIVFDGSAMTAASPGRVLYGPAAEGAATDAPAGSGGRR